MLVNIFNKNLVIKKNALFTPCVLKLFYYSRWYPMHSMITKWNKINSYNYYNRQWFMKNIVLYSQKKLYP